MAKRPIHMLASGGSLCGRATMAGCVVTDRNAVTCKACLKYLNRYGGR